MKLKALIFDVDGTLADTEEAHRCAFNEAFRRHGLDWKWSKSQYALLLTITGGKERLAAYKVPKAVEFTKDLPKSLVGKVLRRELRERELAKSRPAA